MLMMVTDTQILSPQQVCCGCLLANLDGEPRWQSGKLGCGKPIGDCQGRETQGGNPQPDRYECAMGFHLALIS
jgi:hypothetical protein